MSRFLIYFLISTVIFSCKKEEEIIYAGCTDSAAMNYSETANLNNGSCIYAYDIAQGLWGISPNCEEYTLPVIGTTISLNDQLPEEIEILGAGNNLLYIELNDTQLNGTIDNYGNIIIDKQTISIDIGTGLTDIDIEGNGSISNSNSGNINFTYSFDISVIPGFPITESLDCFLSMYR